MITRRTAKPIPLQSNTSRRFGRNPHRASHQQATSLWPRFNRSRLAPAHGRNPPPYLAKGTAVTHTLPLTNATTSLWPRSDQPQLVPPNVCLSGPLRFIALNFTHQLFQFLNNLWQVGSRKANSRGRNTIPLNIGWHMFMMGVCRRQRRVIWMRKVIVPI
jgi:hypothetical protein